MTTFKSLPVGARFEFDHSGLPVPWSGARGPWIKTSARKYKKDGDPRGFEHRVGSINVKVIKE